MGGGVDAQPTMSQLNAQHRSTVSAAAIVFLALKIMELAPSAAQ
jgi:hypothetical protein